MRRANSAFRLRSAVLFDMADDSRVGAVLFDLLDPDLEPAADLVIPLPRVWGVTGDAVGAIVFANPNLIIALNHIQYLIKNTLLGLARKANTEFYADLVSQPLNFFDREKQRSKAEGDISLLEDKLGAKWTLFQGYRFRLPVNLLSLSVEWSSACFGG
mmetsp:Transcript_8558/g.15527  ORF Transcript_8558/g.15527 Transcript_8558/m.15527 type:complete len:158 (-) Transcript_8558:75-548(-)